MNNREFSDKFDLLVGSFKTAFIPSTESGDLVFNEYEKSVFLTEAQRATIMAIYNGDFKDFSFEETEEARRYLANLVLQNSVNSFEGVHSVISDNCYTHTLPEDVMFLIYESVDWDPSELGCKPYKDIRVVPVTHDEFHKLRKNPFRGMTDNRVLRLDRGLPRLNDQYIELYSKYTIKLYKYRYIKKPNPIILEDLPEGLSIDNLSEETECELPSSLHIHILNNAVQAAIQSRIGTSNNQQQQQQQ